MAEIKIHGVPPSTFTRTVRLACHEKGINYELVPTTPGEITPLNPFRKIPAITHGDLVLFESTAILRYFDRTFPGPKLWPEDSVGVARCDQWISAVCDSLVNAALRYMASRYGFLPVPGEMRQQYLDKTREVVPIFDRQLGKSRYLAGDAVTAADLFLAPVLFYFPDIPELRAIADSVPNCARWAAACRLNGDITMATIQIYGVPPSLFTRAAISRSKNRPPSRATSIARSTDRRSGPRTPRRRRCATSG